ncbi:hypothetical protein [Natrarchaeobius chitinivorans]|uniref:Uncharacterized protein n=1 Tax=Natrarchaeobius chitinivorans TaxID=1679083 RepID=A0A3N6PHT3_NATCH|nr:hypothetical protein [Natrarchaeobius chitinivorans]RQG97705.1 hypothetical protein EA473_00345 [Natrarchaeobius chitinivorans]
MAMLTLPGLESIDRPLEAAPMSSGREAADAGSTDRLECVCDRCGDPVRADRVIRISSEPCPELDGRYAAVTKPFCPDCVAGIGLLEFHTNPRTGA